MNANNILFRASQTGKLMTEARSKSEPISETTKDALVEAFIYAKYGIKKEIISKYLEKGKRCEDDAIKLYSEYICSLTELEKNKIEFSNEFIKGTPDIIDGQYIYDIKCPWDIISFFKSQKKVEKDYYWQLQSYMALTGCTSAKITYCLMDTPEDLIIKEKKDLFFRMGCIEDDECLAGYEEIDRLSKYNHLPLNERIYEIEIERNDEDIQKLYKRVQECREWMNKELFKVELLTA
jgi:hypothetical protein